MDDKHTPAHKDPADLKPKEASEQEAQDVRGGAVSFSDIHITKKTDKSSP